MQFRINKEVSALSSNHYLEWGESFVREQLPGQFWIHRTNKGLFFFIELFKCCFLAAGTQLNQQLENWLDKAELNYGPARAIIAP